MSLWAKSQQLHGEALQQVKALYGIHFPIEVREWLAEWIERNILIDFDIENHTLQQYAVSVFESMITELESKAELYSKKRFLPTKRMLQGYAGMLRNQYDQDPLSLLLIMRHCLGTELLIVKQYDEASLDIGCKSSVLLPPEASVDIFQQLKLIKKQTHEATEQLKRFKKEQELLASLEAANHKLVKSTSSVDYTHQNQAPLPQQNPLGNHSEITEETSDLKAKRDELLQMWVAIAEKQKETLTLIESVQVRVLNDWLSRWKREQQLAGNGFPIQTNIYSIQVWCEDLAEIIWSNRQQIQETEVLRSKFAIAQPDHADHLSELKLKTTELLSSLLEKTFIIEEQPPQVIEKSISFRTTARLLVGGMLNLPIAPPLVTVFIISEDKVKTLLRNGTIPQETIGNYFHNTGVMGYNKVSRQLSVYFRPSLGFRKMIIWNVDRAEMQGTEQVMGEKFALLYQSEFSLGDGEFTLKVSTLSVPVVFIVADIEKSHGWATITWDNALAEPGRTPFVVPQEASWSRIVEVLSMKFQSATGRALNELNKRHLASRFHDNPNLELQLASPEADNLMLTWSQFCQEPLPLHNFTFWEWFYSLMELTKKYLRAPWVDKLIIGFIGRNQIEDMLQESPPGTFIIFFSDVELGAVSIAWAGEGREVSMMDPLKCKDSSMRSLADHLSELEQLHYLYPDVPKNQAFGKYYTRVYGATSEQVPNRTPMSKKEKSKAKKKENAKKKAEEEKAKKQEKKTKEWDPYSKDADGFESNISRPKKKFDF